MGADRKTVLERLFASHKGDPTCAMAGWRPGNCAGQTRLRPRAKTFNEALKKFPDDRTAVRPGASLSAKRTRKMLELIETALEKMRIMCQHASADGSLVDAEEYEKADEILTRAFKVNPWHPEAWAYRRSSRTCGTILRASEGPRKRIEVLEDESGGDHLIGAKLSQNYRFAKAQPVSGGRWRLIRVSARAMQLAEDCSLRGPEGWKLAEEVHQHDGYDVTSYNLVTLRGTMQKFQTLTTRISCCE